MAKRRGRLPRELFLSHAAADRKFATAIAETLRRHGIPVWYSESNLVGSEEWHDEIGKALRRCDWFTVVLSPAAVKSMWLKRELMYALTARRFDGRIVPIAYRPHNEEKLSWTLGSIQRVDFTGRFEDGCRELLRIWGVGYQP